jgi:Domain of unknown function (DUF397)
MRQDGTAGRHENPDSGPSADSSSPVCGDAGEAELRGLAWRKSSASTANGDCVEVACLPVGGVAVRDSKDKAGPILRFGHDSWQQFLEEVGHHPFPAP